jgi:hypothetical protein
MLWSLLRCSKQVPEVAVATQQAPEFVALQQQALTLRSVLLQCSKLQSQEAPEVAASLLCCSSKLSRSGACCVAGFSCSKQAPEPRSSGAWSLLASSNKTNKNKIKNKHFT